MGEVKFVTILHAAVTLCVYTMKEGESVQGVYPSGRFTTASQIQDVIMDRLGISKECANGFSIWLSSGHLRKCCLHEFITLPIMFLILL